MAHYYRSTSILCNPKCSFCLEKWYQQVSGNQPQSFVCQVEHPSWFRTTWIAKMFPKHTFSVKILLKATSHVTGDLKPVSLNQDVSHGWLSKAPYCDDVAIGQKSVGEISLIYGYLNTFLCKTSSAFLFLAECRWYWFGSDSVNRRPPQSSEETTTKSCVRLWNCLPRLSNNRLLD